MNNIILLTASMAAGFATGIFFFGGLWFTVQKGITAKTPALWFFISFIIRVIVTMIVFFYISRGGWKMLLLCLAGFLVARLVILKLTGNKSVKTVK